MVINGFNITKKGVLTAYKGKSVDLEIPSEVAEIAKGVFSGIELHSISIPDSVKSIPDDLFWNQRALTDVAFDARVDEIPDGCFRNCEQLRSITIPEGVKRIGKNAFYECVSLVEVVFPNSLKTIESDAFSHCAALKEVLLPDGLETIGEYAFNECDNLYIVSLPSSVALDMSMYPFGFISPQSRRRYLIPEGTELSGVLLHGKNN